MIDSDNLWRCAISKDLMAALGLSPSNLKLIPGLDKIGTAKKGASLGVLRFVKQPLRLRFDRNDTYLSTIQPRHNHQGPLCHMPTTLTPTTTTDVWTGPTMTSF